MLLESDPDTINADPFWIYFALKKEKKFEYVSIDWWKHFSHRAYKNISYYFKIPTYIGVNLFRSEKQVGIMCEFYVESGYGIEGSDCHHQ